MENILEIANDARNCITDFCINTCKAKCCKTGKLPLYNEDEINIISLKLPKTKLKFIENNLPKTSFFNLKNCKCPHLTKNNLCKIHKNIRPKICIDFPVFIKDKYILFANDCPATKQGLFEKYYKQIKETGFTILLY